MAVSVDVNLPRSHTAEFPDRCVRCGKHGPKSHVRLITGTIGWWTWLFWWWGKPYVVKAPACTNCAWKLHGLRFLSLGVTISISLAVLWWIWPHVRDAIPRGLRKSAMLGIGLLCIVPQIIFEVFFAKPFEITAYAESVDYEFTSKDYAIDFAILNMNAQWVKINGEDIKDRSEPMGSQPMQSGLPKYWTGR